LFHHLLKDNTIIKGHKHLVLGIGYSALNTQYLISINYSCTKRRKPMFTNRFARQNTLASFLSILALAGSVLFLRGASINAQVNNKLSDGQVAEQGMNQSGAFLTTASAERWIAQKPELLNQLFVRAVNAGNVEAVVSLFESDAQLAAQPGQPPVQGQAAIRTVVQGWVALELHFESSSREVIQAGDLALLRGPWQVTLTGPDGQAIIQNGHGLEIARRQPDGSWRYVLGVDGD
jgi:ketosteroid isomerase-like protein